MAAGFSLAAAWPLIKHNKILCIATAVISLLLVFHSHDSVLQAATTQLCPPVVESASATEAEASVNILEELPEDPFVTFKKAPECDVARHEIHEAFSPKCQTKQDVLSAMSGGGRYGLDQPYAALGCDMNWYSTAEICHILSHYDRIVMAGDSLVRQLVIAIHILMREDLVEGGRATWRTDNPEDEVITLFDGTTKIDPGMDCRCRTIFSKGSKCLWWEATGTNQIWADDPDSMKCQRDTAQFTFAQMPVIETLQDGKDNWIQRINDDIEDPRSIKNAYIFGAGAWQRYDVGDTQIWLDVIDGAVREGVPSFASAPRLWLSPPAKAINADIRFLESSNNILIQQNIHGMHEYVSSLGYDHLQVYNLTVQASSPDGTHASLENALVEAMMVMNWLDMVKDAFV
ncbi:hypothetical protein FH972_021637 [Carpinus fangiana]|uniref:Trichome birefringence-like N-terminal domain-containing protein n=1 Tax=Carpinus fangiana TaxID=176857 RepID=A0A5N6KPW1_9ROSI|nr:hypothetical protein FH972_021637 [Carpinus fangiana]